MDAAPPESKESVAYMLLSYSRYNCNRYNEDDAKAARDAQEVINYTLVFWEFKAHVPVITDQTAETGSLVLKTRSTDN